MAAELLSNARGAPALLDELPSGLLDSFVFAFEQLPQPLQLRVVAVLVGLHAGEFVVVFGDEFVEVFCPLLAPPLRLFCRCLPHRLQFSGVGGFERVCGALCCLHPLLESLERLRLPPQLLLQRRNRLLKLQCIVGRSSGGAAAASRAAGHCLNLFSRRHHLPGLPPKVSSLGLDLGTLRG